MKATSLKESLKEEDFYQRAIAKDKTQTKIRKQLNPPDMAHEVDWISKNHEISISFVLCKRKMKHEFINHQR